MSDSLCELRLENALSQIRLYEGVISLDSASAEDRAMQVAVWKSGYQSMQSGTALCRKRIEELEVLYAREERRKKRWRTFTLAGVPLSFAGGVFFVLLR
jgi:hypothetical protein